MAPVSYWLMNGTSITSQAVLSQVTDLNWKIVGTPDINWDGSADILWWNQSTGDVTYWLMNGTTFTGNTATVATAVPTAWKPVGHP